MNAIDTNILIYCLDPDNPEKRSHARQLIARLRVDVSTPTLMPWQVLTEFVRYLRWTRDTNKLEHSASFGRVRIFRHYFPLVIPTPGVLDHALRLAESYSLSHWDSMLLGTCLEAEVKTLYTEDMGAPASYEGIHNPFAKTVS